MKPVPTLSESSACRKPSTVPLITPLSKPNRNPPMVATQLINTISAVFSCSGADSLAMDGSPKLCCDAVRG